MAFTIDEESLVIQGRRGDSASFTFDFEFDLSGYTVKFFVKKKINSSTTVIEKEYENLSGKSVTVDLTSTDTALLAASTNPFTTYYWGVKVVKGSGYVETVIPEGFGNFPMMLIYPEIGGV